MHLKLRLISSTFRLAVKLVVLIAFAPLVASAQDAEEQSMAPVPWGHEFGLHVGSLLPNQIDGIDEIMPIVGLRYAYSINFGSLETGVMNSSAHGADYSIFSLSYRGELAPMPDLSTVFYAGPDFHYYRPINQGSRLTDFGFHVGSGMMMLLGGPFWLRADMKFNMKPGTALFIGVGIAIRTPGEGGGQ